VVEEDRDRSDATARLARVGPFLYNPAVFDFTRKGAAMKIRILSAAAVAAAVTMTIACGGEAPPASSTAEPAAAPASSTGRIFFVQPRDGDTIKSMSTLEFGYEGPSTVAAVPPGELTPADVRPGMLHHHLGVDTDCLPDGVVIPKADPWIHFGDGKNVIEMQLAPGQHRLALQAGDDMHRTLPGLCQVITVTVIE
jgi:hypothetical protein